MECFFENLTCNLITSLLKTHKWKVKLREMGEEQTVLVVMGGIRGKVLRSCFEKRRFYSFGTGTRMVLEKGKGKIFMKWIRG